MSSNNKEWDITDFTTQASKFIEAHFKKALIIFVVLILGISLWAYKKSVDRKNEIKAFSELYKITKVYSKKKTDFSEAKEQAGKKEGKDKGLNDKKDLVLASGDMQKDYGEQVEQLENFINNNLGKNASGEAALTLSEIYAEYNRFDKGAEVLSKAMEKWKNENVLYYVMQMRAGDLLASNKQCDKAIPYWEVVARGKSFITEQAQLKLGVCLQEVGKIDEAKTWFEKISAQSPNSTEGFNAKRYLRFLEFKTKNSEPLGTESKAQQKDSEQDNQS